MSPSLPPSDDDRSLQTYSDFFAMTQVDPSDLPSSWVRNDKAKTALLRSYQERQKSHGMFASIPMKCRGESCPYAQACPLMESDEAPRGELCPLETSLIIKRSTDYMKELEIDETKIVDMGLVRDLVDCEVQIERCDRLIAINGDIIQQIDVGVTPDGVIIQRPEVHQAMVLKERMQKRKNEILRLLNSTRQDRAKMGGEIMDPSSHASKIARLYKDLLAKTAEGVVVEADVKDKEER